MSYREYIHAEGHRIYEWDAPKAEYGCDACGQVMDDKLPLFHLIVKSIYENSTGNVKNGYREHNIDLHPGCMDQLGRLVWEQRQNPSE